MAAIVPVERGPAVFARAADDRAAAGPVAEVQEHELAHVAGLRAPRRVRTPWR